MASATVVKNGSEAVSVKPLRTAPVSLVPTRRREMPSFFAALSSAMTNLGVRSGRVGARRSPLHTPEQAGALAREIVARERMRLVGVMAYEAQVEKTLDRWAAHLADCIELDRMLRLAQ